MKLQKESKEVSALKNNLDKKEFIDFYKLCKNGEIDLNTLDSETIHNLYLLSSEDLKIHQAYINKRLKSCQFKLETIQKKLKKL